MARVAQHIIDQINETSDIVDVVSQRVELQKRGKDFFGLCPFHAEKTPSFSVAPNKGIYHCFGCGKGGNSINFIMEYEKIDFIEAVMELGNQLGIDVKVSNNEKSNDFFSGLYSIHELASKIYQHSLFSDKGQSAKKYLTDRGLKEKTLREFKIGFAPNSSSILYNQAIQKGFPKDVIQKCGLFGFSNTDIYDRFRSRIMFPIANSSGRIIAFGGRAFGKNDHAKYLNSPETPLYKKSEVFYGLNYTREHILKEKHSILVEGYTDLIQLYQAGIQNVIAVSGTAFNTKHVNNLRRFTSKIFLAYDGDSAGIGATLKAGYTLVKAGIEPKVVIMPTGMDPDDWIKNEGKDTFLTKGINNAMDLIPFHILSSKFSNSSSFEKSKIIKDILTEINQITDPIIKQESIKILANTTDIDENKINEIGAKNPAMKNISNANEENSNNKELKITSLSDKAEFGLIKIILNRENDACEYIKKTLDEKHLNNERLKKIILKLLDIEDISPSTIKDKFANENNQQLIMKALIGKDEITNDLQIAKDCIQTLKKITIKNEIDEVRTNLKKAESQGKDTDSFITKINDLQKGLSEAIN